MRPASHKHTHIRTRNHPLPKKRKKGKGKTTASKKKRQEFFGERKRGEKIKPRQCPQRKKKEEQRCLNNKQKTNVQGWDYSFSVSRRSMRRRRRSRTSPTQPQKKSSSKSPHPTTHTQGKHAQILRPSINQSIKEGGCERAHLCGCLWQRKGGRDTGRSLGVGETNDDGDDSSQMQ